MDDIERTFFNLLTEVAVLHESMASDAKACRLIDWRRDFNALRSSEPLLRYFWKARDSDVHDAIIKWQGGINSIELEVLDPEKVVLISRQFYINSTYMEQVCRLMRYIYNVSSDHAVVERVKKREVPQPERLESAGLKFRFAIESIALKSFVCRTNGQDEILPEPTIHFNNVRGSSDAHAASRAVLKFYENKLEELKILRVQESTTMPEAGKLKNRHPAQ